MNGRVRFLVQRFGISAPGDLQSYLDDRGVHSLKLKRDETTFMPKAGDLVINWGIGKLPDFWPQPVTYQLLNHADRIRTSTNRIKSLPIMKEAGVNVPKFTTDFNTAKGWQLDGHTVVRRQYNRSFQGHGITIHAPGCEMSPGAALYTLYVPKRREYRVHVFRGTSIDVVQKRKRKGHVTVDKTLESQVRSHDNGWVFCRQNVEIPPGLVDQCRLAVESLGLDFGAVDAGWTESNGKITVYEVNTAPGIDGTTIDKYGAAIHNYIKGM